MKHNSLSSGARCLSVVILPLLAFSLTTVAVAGCYHNKYFLSEKAITLYIDNQSVDPVVVQDDIGTLGRAEHGRKRCVRLRMMSGEVVLRYRKLAGPWVYSFPFDVGMYDGWLWTIRGTFTSDQTIVPAPKCKR